MTEKVSTYLKLQDLLLNNPPPLQEDYDGLLDEMDRAWFAMTPEEIAMVEKVSNHAAPGRV